jgi:hypothetical protein
MKLGMFMMPLHPPGRNAWETLAEDREAITAGGRSNLFKLDQSEPDGAITLLAEQLLPRLNAAIR